MNKDISVPQWGRQDDLAPEQASSPNLVHSVPDWNTSVTDNPEETLTEGFSDPPASFHAPEWEDEVDSSDAQGDSEHQDAVEVGGAEEVDEDNVPEIDSGAESNELSALGSIDATEMPTGEPVVAQEAITAPGAASTHPTQTRRPRRRTGSGQNTLSWQDVLNIFDFSERHDELSDLGKAALADLTDLPRDSHSTEIAEALYPPGSDLIAFTFMLEVVGLVNTGEISFADGARLVSKVDGLPDTVAKSFARQVSGLTGVDIKHRRNSATMDFVSLTLDSLNKTRQNGGLDTLVEIKSILDIWPGGKK